MPTTPPPDAAPVIAVHGLRKDYRMGDETISALNGVDCVIGQKRIRRGDGAVGVRQVDAHEHHRLP